MPPNSVVQNSLLVGGLTVLGYLAGGKLGSMFGAVIGTVVCSLFGEDPMGTGAGRPGYPNTDDEPQQNRRRRLPNYPTRPSNNDKNRKRKINRSTDKSEQLQLSKCSICMEPFKPSILLVPCCHMCFCDDCYDEVIAKKMATCPICRLRIEDFMFVYPS